MREADAHHTVLRGQAEGLDQARGPVVAVADGDPVLVEFGHDVGALAAGHMERDDRRQSAVAARAPANDAGVARPEERLDFVGQPRFVRRDQAIGARQPGVEGVRRLQLVMPVQIVEILAHADATGRELMRGPTRQELVGNVVVGNEVVIEVARLLQQRALAIDTAWCGPHTL